MFSGCHKRWQTPSGPDMGVQGSGCAEVESSGAGQVEGWIRTRKGRVWWIWSAMKCPSGFVLTMKLGQVPVAATGLSYKGTNVSLPWGGLCRLKLSHRTQWMLNKCQCFTVWEVRTSPNLFPYSLSHVLVFCILGAWSVLLLILCLHVKELA